MLASASRLHIHIKFRSDQITIIFQSGFDKTFSSNATTNNSVIQRQIRLIESTDKRYFKNDRYNKTKTSNQTVEQAIDFG